MKLEEKDALVPTSNDRSSSPARQLVTSGAGSKITTRLRYFAWQTLGTVTYCM